MKIFFVAWTAGQSLICDVFMGFWCLKFPQDEFVLFKVVVLILCDGFVFIGTNFNFLVTKVSVCFSSN